MTLPVKIVLSVVLGVVIAGLIMPFMLFMADTAGVPIGPTLGPIIAFGTASICVMAATALVYGGTVRRQRRSTPRKRSARFPVSARGISMSVINRHSVRVFLNQLWRVALLIAVGCCVMLAVLYALAMTGPHGHWFVGAVFAGFTVVSLTTLWKLVPWLTAGDPAQAQTPRQYLATIGFGASMVILWTLLERFFETRTGRRRRGDDHRGRLACRHVGHAPVCLVAIWNLNPTIAGGDIRVT